jgi:hypothetical protein
MNLKINVHDIDMFMCFQISGTKLQKNLHMCKISMHFCAKKAKLGREAMYL